jgi:hypothetical protein
METRQRVKGGWSRGERVGFGGGTSTPVEEAEAAPASGGFGGWCEAVTLRKKRISKGRRKRVFVLTKNGGILYHSRYAASPKGRKFSSGRQLYLGIEDKMGLNH